MDVKSLFDVIQDFRNSMETRLDHLMVETSETKKKLEQHDIKHQRHDRELRKNNVVMFGIKEPVNENREQLKETIQSVLKDKMKVIIALTEINDFLRMGRREPKKNRPILVKFVTYWKKMEVMAQRSNLKGTDIFIENDLCKEDEDKKKALISIMKDLRQKGEHAVLRGEMLYVRVNGIVYKHQDIRIMGQEFSKPGNEDLGVRKEQNKRSTSSSPSELMKQSLTGNTLVKKKKLFTHVRSNSLGQLSMANFVTDSRQGGEDTSIEKINPEDGGEGTGYRGNSTYQ